MRICPKCRTRTTHWVCPNDGFQTVDAAFYSELEHDPLIGSVFEERYRIEDLIKRGGMGAVYKGTQLTMDRAVALKILHADLAKDLREVARFQQEARALAALQHPNIINVIDFGQASDGRLYLVMEFLEGQNLAQLIEEQAPLEPERIVRIARQTLDALAEAHDHSVIHRDLKPDNLFVVKRGRQKDFVKVLDFGIAKLLGDGASEATLTRPGTTLGSPRYMAPEQARAEPVSAQTDLYSLGVIMYEMLTGHSVFQNKTPTGYLVAHVIESPPPPTINGRELKGPLVDLTMQCLHKHPADRPKGADGALRKLASASAQPLDPDLDDLYATRGDLPSEEFKRYKEKRASPRPGGTGSKGVVLPALAEVFKEHTEAAPDDAATTTPETPDLGLEGGPGDTMPEGPNLDEAKREQARPRQRTPDVSYSALEQAPTPTSPPPVMTDPETPAITAAEPVTPVKSIDAPRPAATPKKTSKRSKRSARARSLGAARKVKVRSSRPPTSKEPPASKGSADRAGSLLSVGKLRQKVGPDGVETAVHEAIDNESLRVVQKSAGVAPKVASAKLPEPAKRAASPPAEPAKDAAAAKPVAAQAPAPPPPAPKPAAAAPPAPKPPAAKPIAPPGPPPSDAPANEAPSRSRRRRRVSAAVQAARNAALRASKTAMPALEAEAEAPAADSANPTPKAHLPKYRPEDVPTDLPAAAATRRVPSSPRVPIPPPPPEPEPEQAAPKEERKVEPPKAATPKPKSKTRKKAKPVESEPQAPAEEGGDRADSPSKVRLKTARSASSGWAARWKKK